MLRPRLERPHSRERAESQRHEEVVGLRAISEETIYPHVFENADREVGGVLVGRTPADGSLPMITGAIPAISADERRATLTFTQDSWAHVHRTLDSDFPPDEQIVGWYHSHPGFGIFLSGHDLFIHENFFAGPSQIAVVVDPCACTEGAFVWHEGELASLFERQTPSRWVARLDPRMLPTEAPSNGHHAPAATDESSPYPILALVVAGLIGVLMGLGVWDLARTGDGPSARLSSQPAIKAVHRQRTEPSRAATTITSHIEVHE